MNSKSRVILASVILIPVLLYWGFGQSPQEHIPDNKGLSNTIDYYLEQATIREWSTDGQLAIRLETEKLEHNPQLEVNYLTNPRMTHLGNEKPFYASSDQGIAFDDNSRTDLLGNVAIYSNKGQDDETTLKTEKLSFFPQQNIAQTDQPVTIKSPDSQMKGIGMDINFDDQILNLHSQVEGTHENAK